MKKECPACGKRKGEFVAGYTPMDIRLEQWHCYECHYTWIQTSNGRFIREGILKDPIY